MKPADNQAKARRIVQLMTLHPETAVDVIRGLLDDIDILKAETSLILDQLLDPRKEVPDETN